MTNMSPEPKEQAMCNEQGTPVELTAEKLFSLTWRVMDKNDRMAFAGVEYDGYMAEDDENCVQYVMDVGPGGTVVQCFQGDDDFMLCMEWQGLRPKFNGMRIGSLVLCNR